MVTQPRINFDIEITLVAVEFHSQMLFYNVDFQIDLWICLKSYTYNSQSVTSVLLALSKKTSTSMF